MPEMETVVFGILGVIGLVASGMMIMYYADIRDQRREQRMLDSVKKMGDVLQNSIVATTKAIAEVMGVELRGGEVGQEVVQSNVGPEGNIHDPVWTMWDEEDREVRDFGVGDSVNIDRDVRWDAGDRVAGLGDGESIIPGVPRRDMSGEEY